jgi:hypothetical protein
MGIFFDKIVNVNKLWLDCTHVDWCLNHNQVEKKIMSRPKRFATHNLVNCVKFKLLEDVTMKNLPLKYL